MSLIPVQAGEIVVGSPLPWSVFDSENRLMMMAGEVVATAEQLQLLMENKPMHPLGWAQNSSGLEDFGEPLLAERVGGKTEKGDGTFSFSDMRLKIGDRLQIQPPAQLTQERFTVRLIGYLDGQTLLVTPPYANGLRLPLQENENVVIRYFSGQNAFGFSTTIEKIQKLPFEYFHLSFPQTVKGMIIRKAPRVKTRVISSVTNPGEQAGPPPKSALIANISATGALVDSRQPLGDKGNVIRLTFRVHLHNVDALLNVNAVIRAIFEDETPDPDKPSYVHHGVEFQDLQPNDSVILQILIYQQMIESPHLVA